MQRTDDGLLCNEIATTRRISNWSYMVLHIARTTQNRIFIVSKNLPKVGVEPTHPCGRLILSQLRLPFRHFGAKVGNILHYQHMSQKQSVNQRRKPAKKPLAGGERCLITGFDGFGGRPNNPSQEIVERLPELLKVSGASVSLETMVLETCEQTWSTLKARLKGSSVLIMTGVAAKRNVVSIERFALNIRDYRIKDNHGHQFQGTPIESKGPEALVTTVDLLRLEKYLEKKGFPCEISNHAGTFICNDIYYRALHYRQMNGGPARVLFVHLPMPGRYTRTLLNSKKASLQKKGQSLDTREKQLQFMGKAVMSIAEFCWDSLDG